MKRPRTSLPACPTILDVIGDLLADGCQIEEFLLNEDISCFFGKLPIHSRLLPKVVIPVHASSHPLGQELVRAEVIQIISTELASKEKQRKQT